MAKKKDNTVKISSRIKKLTGGIQANMDSLYTNTYFNNPQGSKDLNDLAFNINKSIDNIINNNMTNTGLPNISKLYSRLYSVQKDKKLIGDISAIFEDNALMDSVMGSYMQNKYLKDLDKEIDTVCKYMPKLLEALETRKDNVLSSDHFSKDFVNVTNDANTSNLTIFTDRIEDLKDRYDLQNFYEEIYDETAKYGETFIYIVPYKKALAKLLANKNGMTISSLQTETGTIVSEGAAPFVMENCKDVFSKNDNFTIKMELNQSNVIESVVRAYKTAEDKMKFVNEAAATNYDSVGKSDRFSHTIDDDLKFDKIKDTTADDGLVIKDDRAKLERMLTVPGCVVKKLDRSSVIPVYIEDMCLGYYYFEFAEYDETFDFNNSISDPLTSLKSNSKISAEAEDVKRNQMLRYISGQISQYIDAKFINNNQDLRKEIYMMLKHNDVFNTPTADNFRVTFVPPEDMIHVYFKKDPISHRGISDLERALFPAKLYASLYITNTIGALTRGQDKRVYYVRNAVDTNIAGLLLNTINQIKKSNFGIRQVENINHVLNIIGRFNDYVIPKGPSGDVPVEFEIMPGQQINPQTELMDALEQMAINATDVPLEVINSRASIDYAVQLTMTNSKFLRKVYNRQAKYQKFCSTIITKLYNAEYNEDTKLTVTLPPPMFLNITNTNQIINNTKEYVNSIWEDDVADEKDETVKAIYKRKLLQYHLGTYINISKHQELYEQARQEAVLKRDEMPSGEDQGGGF